MNNLKNLPNASQHIFIKGDICDSDLVAKTLREYQIDTIVHFAAESHVDRSISGPGEFVQTNLVGTFTMLEAARQYWLDENQFGEQDCRFHHISTDEVYGTLGQNDPAFTETKAYEPNSPYSASKAGADHLVRAYFHTYKLPVTTSNCSNNYGPYQHPEKLIPVIIKNCLTKKPIPIYGDGSNIRDWLYVEDHCDAIYQILQSGKVGEVYNIGGKNESNNLDLVKKICSIMDQLYPSEAPHEKLMIFVTDRKGHDWRYAVDNTKIKVELGWEPSTDFNVLLGKSIDFYIKKNNWLT